MRRRLVIAVAITGAALLGAASAASGNLEPLRRWIAAQTTPRLHTPAGWPAPYYGTVGNRETFALGRRLFHDPKLSKDGSVACASCHQQFAAFAHFDHRVSHGVGGVNGTRNAPGLFNLAWQPELMWDGAINHLDLQPLAPLLNPVEMAATLPAVLDTLQRDPEYPAQFASAFGSPGIDSQRMLSALGQFMATMISDDSRYDRHLNGRDRFSTAEAEGLRVFRARCASCHAEPLLSDFSYRSNGLEPGAAGTADAEGRAAISGREEDRGRFRVPSLRNLGHTAPYMHDGRFATLGAVLDHYAKTFGHDGEADPLLRRQAPFGTDERAALEAFLATLDDEAFIRDQRFAEVRQ